jgi:hypothetical protein
MPNARLAALATMTLTEIITGERLEIARHGKGRSGRTLGYTRVSGADVGEVLIRAHVAVRWGNGRPDWCAVNAVAELRSPMTDAVEKGFVTAANRDSVDFAFGCGGVSR